MVVPCDCCIFLPHHSAIHGQDGVGSTGKVDGGCSCVGIINLRQMRNLKDILVHGARVDETSKITL